MNGKVIGFIHLVVFIFCLWIQNLWFPILQFQFPLKEIQSIPIRALASFCFYGNKDIFWKVVRTNIVLLNLIGIIILIKNPNEFHNFGKFLIFFQGLIHYFFWLFCSNPSQSKNYLRYQLPIEFQLYSLYYFAILFGNLLFLWGLYSFYQTYKKKNKSICSIPAIKFLCPNCGKEYQSNPQFCIACKKIIENKKS